VARAPHVETQGSAGTKLLPSATRGSGLAHRITARKGAVEIEGDEANSSRRRDLFQRRLMHGQSCPPEPAIYAHLLKHFPLVGPDMSSVTTAIQISRRGAVQQRREVRFQSSKAKHHRYW